MALFKIFKGNASNLGKVDNGTNKAYDGYAYFTPDDGKFYIDIDTSNTAVVGQNRIPLSADKADRADNFAVAGTLNVQGVGNFASDLTVGSLMVNGNSQFNNSASFVVIPTAPTAATGTSNTQIATTEFVNTAINLNKINSVTVTLTAGASSAAPKIKVSVNSITSNEVTLTTATTAAYGVVKTIDTYTSADSNSNAVLTGKAVSSLFAEMVSVNDAMVFKGVVATSAAFATVLADSYKAGWVYRANGTFFLSGSDRTYYVESGDIIICTKDKGSSSSISDWQVIEHNIDGALYKSNTTFSGSKILLSSGTNGAVVEGTKSTVNVIKTITWNAGTLPTTGTSFSVPNVTGNSTVTASKVTITNQTVVTSITQASSTSAVIGSVSGGVLTFSKAITAVGNVTATTANTSNVTASNVTATKVTLGTAFSIPNITSVGTLPTLTSTTVSVVSNIA